MASESQTGEVSEGDDNDGRVEDEKRKDYIDWETYFMAMALVCAQRSKDPKTQVGACIVNKDKRLVGTGYNGMPDRCSDSKLPWGKGEGLQQNKHFYVCHAEMNAILNRFSADLKGCKIYVTLFPCNNCTQMIIQSGIQEVVFLSDEKKNKDEVKASKILLKMAKVHYRTYLGSRNTIEIQFPPDPDVDQVASRTRKRKR
ncbi:deoxycytidylate deaminase-like isoform X2 [Haliotis rubra]|uniref:deoxycytidylate deaminase-like isoform X2 n=1 Tax=Haliotis rubra TaxID=36100 RepID=UPI001EE59764|nr:deoxycytidylate deaminase-like isoform X2 [Haliotis rubra]